MNKRELLAVSASRTRSPTTVPVKSPSIHCWFIGCDLWVLEGAVKLAYLAMLFSHVTLAIVVPPLAIALVVLGLRGNVERHRRLARVAWPIWMYVSVTGVLIYVVLYHLNPVPA